jgi:hypothetical protein
VGVLAGSIVLSAASAARAQLQPPPAPTSVALGEWQLAPSLELRVRGEYWRDPADVGGLNADTNVATERVRDAGGVLERTRVALDVSRGALEGKFVLQDARAWGAAAPTGALGPAGDSLAQLGAYEAYVEAHTGTPRPSFVRFGRQAVTWGEGRLLGASDWSPAGRSLDAVRGHLQLGTWGFELLGAIIEMPHPFGVSASDTQGPAQLGVELYGAQAEWVVDPLLRIQAYGLLRFARGSAGTTVDPRALGSTRADSEVYTTALRVHGDARGWTYGVEGAYQFGSAYFLSADRSAYAAAAHVAKTLDRVVLTPTIRIGAAFATGDDGGTTYKQFDPMLPDVHAWYGAMDLFAWSNIEEANARLSVLPWTDTSLAVEYRYAQLYEAGGSWVNGYLATVGHVRGNRASDLGHEIDAAFAWQPWTPLDLGVGYSLFVPGDGARTILAASMRGAQQADGTFAPFDLTHFAYVQATLRVP